MFYWLKDAYKLHKLFFVTEILNIEYVYYTTAHRNVSEKLQSNERDAVGCSVHNLRTTGGDDYLSVPTTIPIPHPPSQQPNSNLQTQETNTSQLSC